MADARGFDDAYGAGNPPWDIGRPQWAVVDLHLRRGFEAPVLDVGCGTGENVLFLAENGLDATGVDVAPRAIERARAKAEARQVPARFLVADVLDLPPLDPAPATVLDVGCFHIFSDADRERYRRSVHGALREGGRLHILCFRDDEPADWGGPRRVAMGELRETFRDGFEVERIEPALFETTIHENEQGGGRAWLATFRRV